MKKILQFIQNRSETSDQHHDDELKTRYYKGMKDGVIKEIETAINQLKGYQLVSKDVERGEMIVNVHNGKKALMIITIITVSPLKTAVDFSVSTDTALPTDFGFSKKTILTMYEKLNKSLRYIGTGI